MPISIPLSDLKVGQSATIEKTLASSSARRRFLDMGFVTGATVKIEQAAPLGDPIELEVKGYSLSMCKNEACNVIIDVLAKKIE